MAGRKISRAQLDKIRSEKAGTDGEVTVVYLTYSYAVTVNSNDVKQQYGKVTKELIMQEADNYVGRGKYPDGDPIHYYDSTVEI